uniref:Putative 3-hydroxyacyl-coa dehydrogenase n=1 Tax=Ixodes ricinus TaxID=34613 RepID=A0A090XC92_IXORI
MLFASVGYKVALFDVEPRKIDEALKDIEDQLQTLEKNWGSERQPSLQNEQHQLVQRSASMADCIKGAIHVQECVFENLELQNKKVFLEMDKLADDKVVLCNSTSCFPPSSFTKDLKHRSQAIVGHPVNPPNYVPLVERRSSPLDRPPGCYPNPCSHEGNWPEASCPQERSGLALCYNRIQYAILNECWKAQFR